MPTRSIFFRTIPPSTTSFSYHHILEPQHTLPKLQQPYTLDSSTTPSCPFPLNSCYTTFHPPFSPLELILIHCMSSLSLFHTAVPDPAVYLCCQFSKLFRVPSLLRCVAMSSVLSGGKGAEEGRVAGVGNSGCFHAGRIHGCEMWRC